MPGGFLGYRRRVTEQGTGSGATLIADRYRLGPVIGRGGMAEIHRATDLRTGRDVAVKILRPEIVADRDLADRFRREALAATVLRHANIVACLDTGTDAAGPFMVMDLIEGEDLAARLRRQRTMLPGEVARVGLDIARGLGVAHARGIVHRDVKPGNILLARDGRAMITDFGIARLAADAEAALPGTTLGSVQYFSPEQAQGTPTSAATDVYGLGLVLFEALTGERPWTGDTPANIALARVGAAPPSPRTLRPEVPAWLDEIVVRALAPGSTERFANGAAMAAALEPYVAVADRGSGTDRHATPVLPRHAASAIANPVVRRRRRSDGGLRRSLAVFGIVGVLLAGAALAFGPALGGGAIAGLADPSTGDADPTADPTPKPTRTPKPTPKPTAKPTAKPTPTRPPAELCRPFLEIACGAGSGHLTPAAFVPKLAFDLGDGWSVARNDARLVTLTRDEGQFLLASGVSLVDASQGDGGDGAAAALISAFAATDGLKATKPATVHIDGRAGRSTDITVSGSDAVALFETEAGGVSMAPGRTTRLVALDVDGETLVLVIEPAEGATLRALLDTADDVAASLDLD